MDMDGTLYKYETAHEAGMSAVTDCMVKQLSVPKRDATNALISARQETKNRLGNTASSHSRLLYFSRSIELLGFNSRPLLSLNLEQVYWWSFMLKIELYNNVKRFLTLARSYGIVLCLVTDLTAQIQYRKLCFLELDEFFDHIVTSEESGADKPSHLSFNLAIQKSRIATEHTWIIGDNFESDIVGGKNAGLATIYFCNLDSLDSRKAEEADIIFDSYVDLESYFTQIKASTDNTATLL
jgi:putative hydrolase of the HAD superfamily